MLENDGRPKVFNLEGSEAKKETKESFGGMSNLDPELIKKANETTNEINEAVKKEGKYFITHKNEDELKASDEMRKRREEEEKLIAKGEKIVRPHLSEENINSHKMAIVTPMVEFEKNNDKHISEMEDIENQINKLQKLKESVNLKSFHSDEPEKIVKGGLYNIENNESINKQNVDISILDEPKWDDPYDTLPLPSRGKIYKGKEKYIKVAYLTADDEDLLSSPNMLRNPDFLKILFNRKILSKTIRYQDLHIGDRNAIMLWLRSTAYGSDYPITFMNPNFNENEPISKTNMDTFDSTINLSSLPIKYLDNVDTDENGNFTFITSSNDVIKFKFLNLMDLEEVERVNNENESKKVSFFLFKIVVSVNGNENKEFIYDYVKKMRALDSRKLRTYYNEIESGVDLRLHVAIPGGGSLDTFLPFTTKFFWPE